jgi:hypothetical protein
MEVVNSLLARKKPDYEAINRLSKVRDDLMMAGLRPRFATPMLLAILGRLKDREQASVLGKLGFRAAETDAILSFADEAEASGKELSGKKLNAPIDAFKFIERMPADRIGYLLAETRNSAALSKIKAYLNKWRPLRAGIATVRDELKRIGMPEGPKFDAVVEQMFALQLNGRGKTPEEREKTLRKLSGIKEPPKQKEPKSKDKKVVKTSEKAHDALMKMQGQPKGKTAEAKPAHKAAKAAKAAKPAKKGKKK